MSLKATVVQIFSDAITFVSHHQWPAVTVSGVLCTFILRSLARRSKRGKVQRKILERGERSRMSLEKLRAQISKEYVDASITEMSFQELQEALKSGRVKAVDALNAYLDKALKVNEATNAITDYIPGAKAEAKALDLIEPSKRGPMHGIPISVKESCGLKGADCTAGLASVIDVPMERDSVTIQVLKAQGAVPFIRTNLPQAMRSFACDNPIFGLTSNPLDNSRGPGGSSGGEGAIVGGGGSILGVGSDIAGSVRIPAAFCGIVALKPTAGRISYVGNFGTGLRVGGQKLVLGSEGPMGPDVASCVQYMRSVLTPHMFNLDPTVPPIPFRNDIYQCKEPLRIGVYTYDGCNRCVPAVVRGVKLVKDVLQSLGHTVVEYTPHDVNYAMNDILWPALLGDDCHSYLDVIENDDTCDIMYDVVMFQQRPRIVRWLLAKWKAMTTYDPMNVGLIGRKATRTVQDWWNKSLDSKAYQGAFLKHWKKQNVDVVISPCMPSVAMKHGLDRIMLGSLSYTAVYNVVNYPAGTLPVTHVTADDVAKTGDSTYYPAKTDIEKLIREDSMTTEGMPVGIQVASLPYKEELVLRVMSEIENALSS